MVILENTPVGVIRMTMAGRSGGCLRSLLHTQHEEPQDRLHVREGLVHGESNDLTLQPIRLGLLPPHLSHESPRSRARARASCLDFTLLKNLLHGVGQGEVSLAALGQAPAPAPGCMALVGPGAPRPKALHGQLQDLPTAR